MANMQQLTLGSPLRENGWPFEGSGSRDRRRLEQRRRPCAPTRRTALRMIFRCILLVTLALRATVLLKAQLPPTMASRIDGVVTQALADGGVPSASIAVVRDNRVAYVKTYGNARLEPLTPARPDMRYCIGSVSKQFLAGSILLLVQEGKLSLDDRVARYLPSLTRAGDITIRQLLSHTSGYQDYYPLDYVAPFMLVPVTADGILDRWARKPLDFEPGTEWQYSNTNYVTAGRIVELVAGTSLMAFLKERIFGPLGMQSPIDLDQQPLAGSDALGYTRFGLGPARPAPVEARGWLFAASELAMTARDLALWDISLMEVTRQIGPLLLVEKQDPQAAQQLEQARRLFSQLQEGKIDRSVLTSDADFYFTSQVLADAAASLKPLGLPHSFTQASFGFRGGMTFRRFDIKFDTGKSLALTTFSTADGKFAQYLIQ